ncbi:hypothetical protein [Rhizorhabdus argentea]|uniref:hypothetical protein n=1 Tax=Rhizorhabdus argentea TaxID=1387174 RepID=UPI0030EF7E58
MSSGYRGLVAASGLTALLWAIIFGFNLAASNYPQEQRYEPYRYAADNAHATELALADEIQPPEYREPCHEPKGQDESDLCAQWKAARAAEAGALWTERSFWAGLFGVVGLIATLHYTRKAVLAAEAATKDADSALTIAERNADAASAHVLVTAENARHQLRAYMEVSQTKYEIRPGQADKIAVRVIFKNGGSTPALDAFCHVRIAVSMGGDTNVDLPLIESDPSEDRPASILQGEFLNNVCTAPFPDDVCAHFSQGDAAIHVYGWVKYRDVFGYGHETHFRFESTAAAIGRGNDFWIARTGNYYKENKIF